MADVNVNAPADQAPTMAPPTRTDDQILPHIIWVPIGKSNCYLDVERSQYNPIYKIVVDILKHTNFFRAFTASSKIPSIYIQHFWDIVRYDKTVECYKCQLDEQCKHKFHPRPDSPLHLPNEEPALGYLKFSAKGTKREVFRMPIPNKLITADIHGETYYKESLEKVAKHQRYLAGEKRSDPDSPAPKPAKATKKSKLSAPKADLRPPVTKPASSQQPEPKLHLPSLRERNPTSSLRSVDEFVDEGILENEPRFDDEEADVQRALEESLKGVYDAPQGPLPPMVIREPDSGKYQPLPEVQGKGKEKVNTMADVNVNAPADQVPTMAPPTRTIKSCLTSDGAFTASSTIPSIYIQQFWDTVQYDKTARCYKCQLDEQWFDLTKYTLRDALQITPVKNNHAFSSPPSSDALINFVNDLGYSKSMHKFHPRPDSLLYFPNKEPVLGYLKFSAKGTKQEVFRMPIPSNLIITDIQGEPYYKEYMEKVAKHQRYLAGEKGSDPDSPAPKPAKATKKSKPFDDEEADVQRALEEILKSVYDAPRGLLSPVVIREPESRKYQLLPEVHGKGKEKVTDEQVAFNLLTLHTLNKKSPVDKFIFQRRTSTPTESTGHDESSSLYAELGLTDSEVESDEDVPGIDVGVQEEGQARPNPRFTATAYPKVHENLKLTIEEQVILEESTSSTRTLSSLQHLAKDLSFGDLFFNDKLSEADNEKITIETKAESIVSVTIQQDTSSIPPMTTPITNLTSRPDSSNVHWPLQATETETTMTTTTTTHPPPPQPQQSTTDSVLMKRIDEI
nr:hypothetical protein [Tanacetum cinerariifolium]